MTADTPKKRLLRVALIGGGLLALLAGYGVFYNVTGFGIPCMLHELTGLQCAGCGLTRAMAAVLRLELGAAFSYHALWPVFALYLLWILVADSLVYIRRGELQFLPGKWWAHIPVAAVIVGYGILRNFL